MKKGRTWALLCIFAVSVGLVFASVPEKSMALEVIKCGDESELSIYGFFRNNLGVFTSTMDYSKSGNQLATARTWFRLNVDYKMSEHFRFVGVTQFVYEPWYPVEEGADVKKNGNEYSEFKDINDILREAYVEWRPNNTNSIKIGRQIAIWGEALTSRVGDVIHPEDSRFAFAFANLEDTRIPQYMIRAVHDFPNIRSSFEWIINPLLTSPEYGVSRAADMYNGEAEGRFAIHTNDSFDLFHSSIYAGWPLNDVREWNASDIIGWPISSSFAYVPVMPFPGAPRAWIPVEGIDVKTRYPDNLSDMRYGFRTRTEIPKTIFGISYWHSQMYTPNIERGALINGTREYTIVYKNYDQIGAYLNRQLDTGVLRAEIEYSPNKPFNTFNMGASESGIVFRDNLRYMVAYDLAGLLYFDWHKTAPIDLTVEHVGEWTPNSSDLMFRAGGPTKYPNYSASFAMRASTNWYYSLFTTELILSYTTSNNQWLVIPSVSWNPNWFDKRFVATLQYIGIQADDDYEGLGLFRKKDMFILTTQFNF